MLQDYKPQLDTPKRQGRLSLVYIQADIGASGAPTIVTANSSPRTTISRDSEALYSITYPKSRFVHAISAVVQNNDSTPTAADGKIGMFVGLDADGAGAGTGTGKVVFAAGDDGALA